MSSTAKHSRKTKSDRSVISDQQGISKSPFPIVGIGASAGGLEAFTRLLAGLPAETGTAFVLVQHLDPHHESQLTSLLARATTMRVQQVRHGMAIKPNHVYVIPPNADLILSKGRLLLSPRGDAGVRQNQVGGAILGGTGAAGTFGMSGIQDANSWLAAIVESTNDAVIGVDLEGRIISCNRGATLLYGYAAGEMIGKSILMFGTPAVKEEQAKIIETIRQGDTISHYETIRQKKDGSLLDVSLTVSPVKDINGKIIGISKIARDITDRKRAEITLRESLERETAARRSAESASLAKDEFLAALSHELRTPLNPVLLIASDAVKDRDHPPQVRANFEIIRKNIELEARLIDDLLDMTRISCGKLGLEMRRQDAHAILQETVTGLQTEADEKQIRLAVSLTAKEPAIHGDMVRLRQIFGNILGNAIKFTPPHGKITIQSSSSKATRNFRVKISDTGIGMTKVELQRVFAAFSQGDHVNRAPHRFGGLGLGLAIARKLVELHGGQILAASEGPGKGSSFMVQLPLTSKTDAGKLRADSGPAAVSLPETGQATRQRILVIEDHEPTRNALAHLLLRRRHSVVTAGTLAEARAVAGRQPIDLVISDIGLPDGNGNDLMRELSQQYGLKGVALTGYGMEQDLERSRAAGFVAHLTKPVRIQALEKILAGNIL